MAEIAEVSIGKNEEKPERRRLDCLQGYTLRMLEDAFERYGVLVASHPLVVIAVSVALTLLFGSGLFWFRAENEGIKLWIPHNSDHRLNSDWLAENFPPEVRFNSLLFVGDNVLKAEVIQAMYRVSKSIRSIQTVNNDTWPDMCLQRPVVKTPSLTAFFGRRRKRRDLEFDELNDEFEAMETPDLSRSDLDAATTLSLDLYPEPYCSVVEGMPKACFETSILELFGHNGAYDDVTDKTVDGLTDEQVLDAVNNRNISGIFLLPANFTSFLSGIRRDDSGQIVSAAATYIHWFGRMNMTAAKLAPVPERVEPMDPRMLEWEGQMLDVMQNTSDYPEGLTSYPHVGRSFNDIAGATILGDVSFFVVGYMLMFTYVTLALGKFSCVEHRSLLSTFGILGVIMGIVVSYGICSAAGLFYGPMHSVMPFLMLGIGIDDMFVIVQCWDTLTEQQRKEPLVRRFGFVMRQAGAAITVTSATDVIAFGIGGFTILPALQSFCIYASVGIVATFLFQSSFFLACMSLDQRRIEARRNGCCPCYVHPEDPNRAATSQGRPSLLQNLFGRLGGFLLSPPVKVAVIVLTLGVTGVGIWGNVLLRQKFDPIWFLPPDTYLAQWFANLKQYFPAQGERATIYFSGTSLPQDLPNIDQLVHRLSEETAIVDTVDGWSAPYLGYLHRMGILTWDQLVANSTDDHRLFRESLTQFLFSPTGAAYQRHFRFGGGGGSEGNLTCGQAAPPILMSSVSFVHRQFGGPEEHVPAMNRVKQLIREANISGKVFAMALGYATWETDEIISVEVYRNIGLAMLCVFFTILLFLSNLTGALIVMACVCLTLVDVGGFMHFWGLTIDTVSCNNLIIAIGLCVDYSSHIMHRYLTESGGREERVSRTLANIGPAVLNGGFSTFLAFILLAPSKSHVFSSFFKIFFLVVTFGLYQGLVFLPVLLSLVGPLPADNAGTSYVVVATSEPAVEAPVQTIVEPPTESEGEMAADKGSVPQEKVQSKSSTISLKNIA